MIAVVACGNPNRSDDGAALAVLEHLRNRGFDSSPDLRLLDAGTDGMATIFAARGCRSLIVVDACKSGSEPGAIFEVPGDELKQTYAPNLTLHDFRWDHALHAGKQIFRDQFPDDVVVLLIEARSLDLGVGLSSVVSDAAIKVADRIQSLLEAKFTGVWGA